MKLLACKFELNFDDDGCALFKFKFIRDARLFVLSGML
jgi:hypothetical protein